MEPAEFFLRDLAVVLCVAAVTTVVCHRLRQPVVLGYLLAGLIVGPHIPVPLVADLENVRTLAELGVILLMFSLGLEFNFHRLARLGPRVGITAAVEIGLMLTLGYLSAQLLGWSVAESLLAGAVVAISSTMIIVRTFSELRVTGRLADLVFGVLIMEDLAAILLLAALSAFADGDVTGRALLVETARLIAFLGGVLAVGLLVVPRAVRAIVRLRRPETTLVATVGICFAAALLARSAGYSVALGAFLAGSLVSEAGGARQVEPLVRPLRDLFAAIFFVAVGMLLDPRLVAEYWATIAVFSAVVIGGKIIGVSIGAFLAGHSTRLSLQAGMSLAQIGEFSFIIAGVGRELGTASERLYPVAVSVSVLTAFATPWLIRLSEPLALLVDRRLPKPIQTFVSLYGSWIELLRGAPDLPSPRAGARRVIRLLILDAFLVGGLVIGVAVNYPRLLALLQGFTGMDTGVARLVVLAAAAACALPFVIGIVGLARSLGRTLSERALPLAEAGRVDLALAPRRALASTIQLAVVLLVGLTLIAFTQPFLPAGRGAAVVAVALVLLGIAFWRTTTNLQGHVRAGAEIAAAALSPDRGADRHALDAVQQLLPGMGTMVSIRIDDGSPAAGRTLAELNLRGRTGATVVALSRGADHITFPTAREVLQSGDVLALTGSREAIDAAREILLVREQISVVE